MDFDLANIELEIKEDIMREEAKIREEEKKKEEEKQRIENNIENNFTIKSNQKRNNEKDTKKQKSNEDKKIGDKQIKVEKTSNEVESKFIEENKLGIKQMKVVNRKPRWSQKEEDKEPIIRKSKKKKTDNNEQKKNLIEKNEPKKTLNEFTIEIKNKNNTKNDEQNYKSEISKMKEMPIEYSEELNENMSLIKNIENKLEIEKALALSESSDDEEIIKDDIINEEEDIDKKNIDVNDVSIGKTTEDELYKNDTLEELNQRLEKITNITFGGKEKLSKLKILLTEMEEKKMTIEKEIIDTNESIIKLENSMLQEIQEEEIINKVIFNRQIFDYIVMQNEINTNIRENKKFLIGKMSLFESLFLNYYITKNQVNLMETAKLLSFHSGIHVTNINDIKTYCNTYIQSIVNSNLLGEIPYTFKKKIMNYYNHISQERFNTTFISHICFEPYLFFKYEEYRLNHILKGKRILVITSHARSIESQIKSNRYTHVFSPNKIFEDNTFTVIKSPVTNINNHGNSSWMLHFNNLVKEVVGADEFDIALVSCGGYSMPICSFIYEKLNKSAIYVGSTLQLFFGVMGNMWLNDSIEESPVMEFYLLNQKYWIRPRPDDRPLNYEKLGDGCYW